MNKKLRTIIAVIILAGIGVTISWVFWRTEIVYSLPTPVPDNFIDIDKKKPIEVTEIFSFKENKPVLIHFFNPECPCSRFNMPHVKKLIQKYGTEINFAMVVVNNKKKYSQKEIQDKYDLKIPVSFDPSLAEKCGIYSTPQAVLLDENNSLYFKGNYNRNRYCTSKESEYVKMAIDSLLNNHQSLPEFGQQATLAYGCQIPACTK